MDGPGRSHVGALWRGPLARLPDETGWKVRHTEAVRGAFTERPDNVSHERALAAMLAGWAAYADRHRTKYGSGIGEDSVLGPSWANIGVALAEMMNGEHGRLDAGTVDRFVRASLAAEGFEMP